MVISTVEKEIDVYEEIHVEVEPDSASIFLGNTHFFMQRKTFERLLFTMQGALLEEELLGQQVGE
jgi:hypothetical protein